MSTTATSAGPPRSLVRRAVDRTVRTLGEDARRLREDAGLTRAAVARAAGIDASYLGEIEDGRGHPSIEVLIRISMALGADLGAHLYPNTGPAIRDRHQARMLEALLATVGPRWRSFTEVAVRRPARGWMDLVLHDPTASCVVAVEIQSSLRRLEQLVRWTDEKAASLPSWSGFEQLAPVRHTSKLLVVMATRTTQELGIEFARRLAAAYPVHPEDALGALTGTSAWPGSALIWARLTRAGVRFLPRRAS